MIKTVITFLIIITVGATLYALIFSNSLIFLPPNSSYKDNKNIIKLKTRDGAIISAIYLLNKNAKYTILISHGNAEDLGTIQPILRIWQAHEFSVFAYDYQGYGTSTGKPSEKHAYNDVMAAYNYLIQTLKIPPNRIIAYGHSLGAAVAIDLASQKPIAAVIAQSPFVTAFRVVTRFPILPFDKFNNLKKIQKIHCPILIIHGMKDSVIGFWHGKLLYQKANKPKQHLWIKNAGHNNIMIVAGNRYWKAIKEFVHKIKPV